MNKGQRIRAMLEQGKSVEQILDAVDTTENSIRWHKSKMSKEDLKSSTAIKAEGLARFIGRPVSAVIDHLGFEDRIREAIKAVVGSNNIHKIGRIYHDLLTYTFIVNGRVISRVGQCNYRKRTIEVHELYLTLPKDFETTFLHECAHALDYAIHGRSSGHGYPWKRIMHHLGLSTNFRSDHSEEATRRMQELRSKKAKKSGYMWECEKCGEQFDGSRRKYPAHTYTHSGCGGKLWDPNKSESLRSAAARLKPVSIDDIDWNNVDVDYIQGS